MSTTTSGIPREIQSITFDAHLDKVLLFGDSITQRAFSLSEGQMSSGGASFVMGAALADLYLRRMDVVHRGFSGYCTEHARYIVDDIIEAEKNLKLAVSYFDDDDEKKKKRKRLIEGKDCVFWIE